MNRLGQALQVSATDTPVDIQITRSGTCPPWMDKSHLRVQLRPTVKPSLCRTPHAEDLGLYLLTKVVKSNQSSQTASKPTDNNSHTITHRTRAAVCMIAGTSISGPDSLQPAYAENHSSGSMWEAQSPQ